MVEVDNAGQVRAVGEAATPYRPSDAQVAYHLGRFIELVRSLRGLRVPALLAAGAHVTVVAPDVRHEFEVAATHDPLWNAAQRELQEWDQWRSSSTPRR